MRFTIKTVLLLFILFYLAGCTDSANNITDNTNTPGRRDYLWKLDTLKMPEGYTISLYGIWGANPKNVWAVGIAYSRWYSIWHYDGRGWSIDSVFRRMDPCSIYGFAEDDIWVGTNLGEFWHYDGSQWKMHWRFDTEGYNTFVIIKIFGRKPDDIYAVGYSRKLDSPEFRPMVFHFNGKIWDIVIKPDVNAVFDGIAYDYDTNRYYISSSMDYSGGKTHKIYSYDGKTIEPIYETDNGIHINNLQDGVFCSEYPKIYRIEKEKLIAVKDLGSTTFMGMIWGRSSLDFFTTNSDGLGHCNGNDFSTIFNISPEKCDIANCHIYINEIFVLIDNYRDKVSCILHGELK